MLRCHCALLACVVIVSTSNSAMAVPAPMSKSELELNSDVVAKVRVLSVTCLRMSQDSGTGQKLGAYRAKVLVVEARKGAAPGDVLNVDFSDVTPVLGSWSVPYYVGEVSNTHLVWEADKASLTTFWWNAKETLESPQDGRLPTRAGETITSPTTASPTLAKSSCVPQPTENVRPGFFRKHWRRARR